MKASAMTYVLYDNISLNQDTLLYRKISPYSSGGFESPSAIYPPWDSDISVACVTEALQPPAGLSLAP